MFPLQHAPWEVAGSETYTAVYIHHCNEMFPVLVTDVTGVKIRGCVTVTG